MFEDLNLQEKLNLIEKCFDAMLMTLEFYDDPERNEELGAEGVGRQLVVDSIRLSIRGVLLNGDTDA